MKPKVLELTLLRHGRSRADEEQVHEGRYDSPLTALGIEQAERLADWWLTHPPGFEALVSSPLSRAAFERRARQGLEEIMLRECGNVLVVAHGGILNMALRDLLGAHRASFTFGDTAFAWITVARNRDHATLRGIDLQPHLIRPATPCP